MTKWDFEKLLLEAVDEGLSWLGKSCKQAVYFHLERSFKIEKHEIPCRIEDFAAAIEEIFSSGAKVIEIYIMKHLYKKVGQASEWNEAQEDLVFTDYVEAARRSFLKKKELELVQLETGRCECSAKESFS